MAKAKNPGSPSFTVVVFLVAVIFFSTAVVDTISCEGKRGRKLARLHLCGWRFLSWVWYLRLCLFRLILALSRRQYEARTNLSRCCLAGWIVTLGWSSPLHQPTRSCATTPNPSSNNREIPAKDSSIFGLILSVCVRGNEYRLKSLRDGPWGGPLPYASLHDPMQQPQHKQQQEGNSWKGFMGTFERV